RIALAATLLNRGAELRMHDLRRAIVKVDAHVAEPLRGSGDREMGAVRARDVADAVDAFRRRARVPVQPDVGDRELDARVPDVHRDVRAVGAAVARAAAWGKQHN